MGVHKTIDKDKFPTQGAQVGFGVYVCFHYDTSNLIRGTILRDDMEEPFLTVIQLDNGRVVTAAECQYQLIGV